MARPHFLCQLPDGRQSGSYDSSGSNFRVVIRRRREVGRGENGIRRETRSWSRPRQFETLNRLGLWWPPALQKQIDTGKHDFGEFHPGHMSGALDRDQTSVG